MEENLLSELPFSEVLDIREVLNGSHFSVKFQLLNNKIFYHYDINDSDDVDEAMNYVND